MDDELAMPTSSVIGAALDASLWTAVKIDDEDLQFLRDATGIQDDDELRVHVIRVQKKAFEIFPYNCIRRFGFVQLKISKLSAYEHVLKLGREQDALLLDIGCCFGNDARKAITDGFPIANVLTSDLRPEFYDLGLELFNIPPSSSQLAFVAGDAFDPAFISPAPPVSSLPLGLTPDLKSLHSLNPLQGRIHAIHASAFFHLFEEAEQSTLAHRLASLLSPLKGSTILGLHGAKPEKGYRTELRSRNRDPMFCHCPESWKEMWLDVFGQEIRSGTVKVEAKLIEHHRPDLEGRSEPGAKFWLMDWSVTRL